VLCIWGKRPFWRTDGDESPEKKRPRPGAVKTAGAGVRRPDEISTVASSSAAAAAAAAADAAAHVHHVYVRFRRRF